jgi:PTH1 family peptidyl-tRNA hydrolase
MKVVLGLGNPGRRHRRDRHNVGAMVVDRIADRFGASLDRVAHGAKVAEVRMSGERVLLMKPETYMNLSGEAAASVARYYHLDIDAFVAVHDDLDLPVGRIRVRQDGGAGGHRGVTSLIMHLGDRGFSRVRLGIGRPPAGVEAAEFVLSPFSETEWALMEACITHAADAVEVLVREGPARAMNRYNVSGAAGPLLADAGAQRSARRVAGTGG